MERKGKAMAKQSSNFTRRAALLVAATASLIVWAAGPAHAQFRIGPEDVLQISVLGNKDLDLNVTVQPDGKISYPMAGEVQAAGLTANELAEKLTAQVRILLRDAVVAVTVREVNSYKLFLVGAVGRPGTVRVRSETTLLQLLSQAGGVTEGADAEKAYIVRRETRIPVNIKKLLEGDPSQNPTLLPGDTIVIPSLPPPPPPPAVAAPGAPGLPAPDTGVGPEAAVVYVMGEVRRPGAIQFAKDLNVIKVLALAGGFTPFASPSKVKVLREEDAKKVTLQVDVGALLKGDEEAKDVVLKVGDVIHVPESLF